MPPTSKDNDPANMAIFEPGALSAMAQDRVDTTAKPKTSTQNAAAARGEEKEARLREKETRLQGGKGQTPHTGPAPPPPRQAVAPPPPVVDKSDLLDRLEAYRKRFPQLKKRNNISVRSTVEEIMDELHYCEMQLGSADGNQGAGVMAFIATMNVLETTTANYWNPLGLELQGLTKVCKDNIDQVSPILDELIIKYATGMYVGPEARLVFTVGALVATVHAANTGNTRVADAMSKASHVVTPPAGAEQL